MSGQKISTRVRDGIGTCMHKGLGVIRDELLDIGPKVAKPVKQEVVLPLSRVTDEPPKEMYKEERGAKKIRQLLGKPMGRPKAGDVMWKLTQILANRL